LAIAAFASAAQAQPADHGRFLRWVAHDTRDLIVAVAPFAPALAVGSTAIVNSGSPLDARLSQAAHSALGRNLPLPLKASNEVGSPKGTIFAAAAFGATMLTRNTRLQDAAFTSLQSVLLAGGMSYALKYSLGRVRPYDGSDGDEFEPYSGNTSFPSGHTTAAFALVTPWVYYYPSPFTYALFGVAGGTAVARVAKQHHWPTDVAAGAALGFFTARFLSKRHLAGNDHLSIQPVAYGKGAEIRLSYRF